jgi:hypothetical protein
VCVELFVVHSHGVYFKSLVLTAILVHHQSSPVLLQVQAYNGIKELPPLMRCPLYEPCSDGRVLLPHHSLLVLLQAQAYKGIKELPPLKNLCCPLV